MGKRKKVAELPEAVKQVKGVISELTREFCHNHLNNEYAQLSQEIIDLLGGIDPSPLLRGKGTIWAAGIIYALGYVNFLFDKTTKPYISADELCTVLGVKKSTAYNKSVYIRETFGMIQFDPLWCLPSLKDQNPLIWMLEINGLAVDARYISREMQEIAYQKGLIPYIPEAVSRRSPDKATVAEENKTPDKVPEYKKKEKKESIDPSQISWDF